MLIYFANKSRRKPCMESAIYCGMESDQRSEWNHGNAVYGLNPKEKYTLARDAIRLRRFHTPCG